MIKRRYKSTVPEKKPIRRKMNSSTAKPKKKYKSQKTKWKQIQDFYPLLQHPEKYVGVNKVITLRSSYEINYAIRLDNCEDVVEWSSEDVVIWYQYPVNQNHRYFTDFYIKMKNGKEYIIEVKPLHETREPVQSKNEGVNQRAMFTYEKNKAKCKGSTPKQTSS